MRWQNALLVTVVITASVSRAGVYGDTPDARHAWSVHDRNRPLPPVVQVEPGKPPADAVILFDGSSLDAWVTSKDKSPCKWRIEDGVMVVPPKGETIETRQSFGDCQLHLEFATPARGEGSGQGLGNSGVFLMGMHEIQILDSYKNDSYADGQAAAVYAENPPMVNVSRAPGEWQSFDIIFHQPIWEGGVVKYPGTVTVLHNGVLVQDHWELEGLTTHLKRRPLQPYGDKLPLKLQDHGDPVRFRNIWIREIPSRYANQTHGGPGVDEQAVVELRKQTAAQLFAKIDLGQADTRNVLGSMLEVISYHKSAEYLQHVVVWRDRYLKEIATFNEEEAKQRKGELIGVRKECDVLMRNNVADEVIILRDGVQRVINEFKLEKKN